jgi:hypothetical protein
MNVIEKNILVPNNSSLLFINPNRTISACKLLDEINIMSSNIYNIQIKVLNENNAMYSKKYNIQSNENNELIYRYNEKINEYNSNFSDIKISKNGNEVITNKLEIITTNNFIPINIYSITELNTNLISNYKRIYQTFIYDEYDKHIETINTRFTKIESEMIHKYLPPIPFDYIQIGNGMPNLEFNFCQLQMFIKEINIFKTNIYNKYESLENIYNIIIKMLQN